MIQITEDIRLEELKEKHAPEIFRILDSERDYMRIWLPFVDNQLKVKDSEDAVKMLTSGINMQFCIFYQNKFVGLIGFKDTDETNKRTEIGYWLSQAAQKKGVMIRSVKALLDYAFSEMEMNRVQIKAALNNLLSRAIPEKLGFWLEGIERDGELLVDNKYTDIAVYSMLKREYIYRCKS